MHALAVAHLHKFMSKSAAAISTLKVRWEFRVLSSGTATRQHNVEPITSAGTVGQGDKCAIIALKKLAHSYQKEDKE